MLLAAVTVAPLPLGRISRASWAAPLGSLVLLGAAALVGAKSHITHGYQLAATGTFTVSAAMFGGIPLPPWAFRIARRQPDAGETLPTAQGPLRGGRMIGVLERAAVAAAVLGGWEEGLAVTLAVKSLARYPDLRDSGVSEQFIIGTFTSVLWALSVAALGRHIMQ